MCTCETFVCYLNLSVALLKCKSTAKENDYIIKYIFVPTFYANSGLMIKFHNVSGIHVPNLPKKNIQTQKSPMWTEQKRCWPTNFAVHKKMVYIKLKCPKNIIRSDVLWPMPSHINMWDVFKYFWNELHSNTISTNNLSESINFFLQWHNGIIQTIENHLKYQNLNEKSKRR